MAKKKGKGKAKSKEISLDELESELKKSKEPKEEIKDAELGEEEVKEETVQGEEKEPEEKVEEIEEFSLEKVSEEEEIGEIFEEKAEKPEVAEAEEAPKEEIIDERIYIIPLSKARQGPRTRYAKKAIRYLREYMQRHFKPETLVISQEVNEKIWSRGIEKPPRKIRVRATKNVDGLVVVYLA
jgi:large subunit ribosomal protein L31e